MKLKEKINKGKDVYGTWCLIPSPEVINIISKAGLDFVLIDMEHGLIDFTILEHMVIAAEAENCEAIIRVSTTDEIEILKALETGASGVIVPHVESVEDREKAMSFMKYPPLGMRGFSPFARAGGYTTKLNHTTNENKRILTGILIEGQNGIENIKEIIDDPELDIIYVGTYDISSSLGIAGDVNNEKVLEVLERCTKIIRESGKSAGCLFHSQEELSYFKKIGINFLLYKVDTSMIHNGYAKVKGFKEKYND